MPSYREGKVARVRTMAGARGLEWADVEHSTFYSDSTNDMPLLEKVTSPWPPIRTPGSEAIAAAGNGARAYPEPIRMIKKFIDRLLGKSPAAPARRASPFGKREDVPVSVHGIDLKLVDQRRTRRGAHPQAGRL